VSTRVVWLAAVLVCLPSLLEAEIVARRQEDGTLLLVTVAPSPPPGRALRRLPPPQGLTSWIDRYATEHALDPRLVQALIQVESGYDAAALSRKGAMGLMQLMPDTARELGVLDPWDAVQNLRGGTRYLRQMLDRFAGDLELALAGYNAGPGAVERHRGVPPYRETTDYVKKVMSLYRGSAAYSPPAASAPAASPPAALAAPRGRPVVASRDARGRLVLTTPR
jgi:soluble lytic murein transglycosylase-like protein